jgi:hypothetical protein
VNLHRDGAHFAQSIIFFVTAGARVRVVGFLLEFFVGERAAGAKWRSFLQQLNFIGCEEELAWCATNWGCGEILWTTALLAIPCGEARSEDFSLILAEVSRICCEQWHTLRESALM